MKKIVFPIIFGMLSTLIFAGLSGCLGTETENIPEIDKFVGTWNLQGIDFWHELSGNNIINFTEARTFDTDSNLEGTYNVEGENLVLTLNEGGQTMTFSYTFTDKNQLLALVDSNQNAASYVKV